MPAEFKPTTGMVGAAKPDACPQGTEDRVWFVKGGIAISVGGLVIVKPPEAWHALAKPEMHDSKPDGLREEPSIDSVRKDGERHLYGCEERDEARKALDENATEVMRLQGELAEARGALKEIEYLHKAYEQAKRHAHRWWGKGDTCQCCGEKYPLHMRVPDTEASR